MGSVSGGGGWGGGWDGAGGRREAQMRAGESGFG